MENKRLNYLFSNGGKTKRRITLMLKNEAPEESRSCVEIDIVPKDGELISTAKPIFTCASSFQDSLAQLRNSNGDFCDSDIWDGMAEKCVIADKIDWDDVTAGPDVQTPVNLTSNN